MNNSRTSLHRLTQAAVIAALYTALTLILPVASFGPVQFRFSEMLTVLPTVMPVAIPGLTVGCVISNLIGVAMGANIAGAWDILVGSSATLLAALCTYALRNVRIKGLPVLATLPPVLFNAVLVGGELTVVSLNRLAPVPFLATAGTVGLGQLVPCVIGGLILFALLEKTGFMRHFGIKP